MATMHQTLTEERWFKFSMIEQLANIGCDISRAIQWRNRGDKESSIAAFFRALELIDLTIADPKNRKRLKEVCRAREFLVDFFMYDNIYGFTDEFWHNYFMDFNYAAALQRGK